MHDQRKINNACPKRPRRGALLAILATIAFSVTFSPARAAADGRFAAIYYSFKDDYFVWADGWETQKKAEKEALSQCLKEATECKEALWFNEGCGSVAVGGKVVAWGWDDTAVGAIQAALARCAKDGGTDCINKGSHCA